jgi:hypothetical protein
MKFRALLLCLALVALAVCPAAAQVYPTDIPGQLYLGWEDCAGGGAPNFKFLNCIDPLDRDQLFASATAMVPVNSILANISIIDVIAGPAPAVMPPFWQFNTGGCGDGQMLFSSDFSLGPFGCFDLWFGLASSGGQYGGENSPLPVGNRARIKMSSFVSPGDARNLPPALEAYIARITLRHGHVASCPGCFEPACIVYQEEQLSTGDNFIARITNPGYAAANAYPQDLGCPGSTPTQSRTWGQVKALYR